MKICETCKKEYSDSLKFCTQCGSKLEEKPAVMTRVHKCPACNIKYPDNTRFCSQCGTTLVDVEEEAKERDDTGFVPVPAVAGAVTKSEKAMDSAESSEIAKEATEWEFSSRFLLRFAKEAKVTASESMLTVQKSFGFIFYAVLTLSKSAPVVFDIRNIQSVTVKERYSIWAGFFFFLALACMGKDNFVAAIIFAIIGYVELKYTTITINYSGGKVEFGESDGISSDSVQNFLNYVRKYNPDCIC